MEVISKATLLDLFKRFYDDEFMRVDELETLLMSACKELDPWLPIDENTPGDEELLLSFRINEGLRKIRIGFYNDSFGMTELATHYKILK